MTQLSEAKAKAAITYNAAAPHFDHPALGFWDRFGQGTVDRLHIGPGDAVLDVCAGTGASAIPAAERVGPSGRVVAVDLADDLLALASEKAQQRGLTNLEVRNEDLETLDYLPGTFDAVVIVFGIFFLPDWPAATAGLWRLVKPGGQLAITTWGPDVLEPASTVFWDTVAELRPDLHRGYNPWDDLTDPGVLRALLVGTGATEVQVEAVDGSHPLTTPDDFWNIVLGTGYRATWDAMAGPDQQLLEERVRSRITERRITKVQTNVIYSVATKA